MTIWILRLTGTHTAIVAWLFRAYYYPVEHPYAGSPFALCLFGLAIIGDLWYPVVFRAVKGAENRRYHSSGTDVAAREPVMFMDVIPADPWCR